MNIGPMELKPNPAIDEPVGWFLWRHAEPLGWFCGYFRNWDEAAVTAAVLAKLPDSAWTEARAELIEERSAA